VTRQDEILGCSCLFVIVALVITGIVLLILNWGAIFGSAGHSSPPPTPTATATATATVTATVTAT
jgi:hypothetical protein